MCLFLWVCIYIYTQIDRCVCVCDMYTYMFTVHHSTWTSRPAWELISWICTRPTRASTIWPWNTSLGEAGSIGRGQRLGPSLLHTSRLWDPQMFETFWRTMKGHPIGCARCVHLLVDSLQVFSFAVQSLCSVHKTILRSWFASKLVYQFPKVDGLNISHTWAKLIYTRQVQFSGSTGSPISPVHI